MKTREEQLERKIRLEKREEKKGIKKFLNKTQKKVNMSFDFTREEIEHIERQFFEREY